MKLIRYVSTDENNRKWQYKVFIPNGEEEIEENLKAGVPLLRELDFSSVDIKDLHNIIHNFLIGYEITTYESWKNLDYTLKVKLGLSIANNLVDSIVKKSFDV